MRRQNWHSVSTWRKFWLRFGLLRSVDKQRMNDGNEMNSQLNEDIFRSLAKINWYGSVCVSARNWKCGYHFSHTKVHAHLLICMHIFEYVMWLHLVWFAFMHSLRKKDIWPFSPVSYEFLELCLATGCILSTWGLTAEKRTRVNQLIWKKTGVESIDL